MSKETRIHWAAVNEQREREAAEIANALGLNVQSVSTLTCRIGPMARPNSINDSILVGHGGKTWQSLLRLARSVK